jgi:hypothetical protein
MRHGIAGSFQTSAFTTSSRLSPRDWRNAWWICTRSNAYHSPESVMEGVNVLDRPQPRRVSTRSERESKNPRK